MLISPNLCRARSRVAPWHTNPSHHSADDSRSGHRSQSTREIFYLIFWLQKIPCHRFPCVFPVHFGAAKFPAVSRFSLFFPSLVTLYSMQTNTSPYVLNRSLYCSTPSWSITVRIIPGNDIAIGNGGDINQRLRVRLCAYYTVRLQMKIAYK